MSMGFSQNSVVGLDAFYDDLIAFAVARGWTVAETITTRNKILKSNGEDLKASLVYQLMTSTSAGNPFKAPYNVHVKIPHVLTLGWNAWTVGAPGAGSRPYGQVGPWMFGGTNVGSINQPDSARVHRFNGTFPLTLPMDATWLGRTRRLKTADSFENIFSAFDGRRKVYGPNIATTVTTALGWSDMSHGEANVTSAVGTNLPGQGSVVLVHDAVTDKDFVYFLNGTSTLLDQWKRYDPEANTTSSLAAPPWSAASPTGGGLVWDGADTIYAIQGANTTSFAKYSISGNSWTSLTVSPVARASNFATGSSGCTTNMVYVPGAVSGLGQDVIYLALAASGTVIYRYRVTDNAWDSTAGTGALTAQQTIGSTFFLAFDGIKYLYHGVPNTAPFHWFRSDASVAPNTWTDMGAIQSTNRVYTAMQVINHVPCKIRSHASQTTYYWMLGDKDAITVVVKIDTSPAHYYWMHFGKFNSSNRQEIMVTTAISNPGGRTTITVDDTTKYFPGEAVTFWNALDGVSERTRIYDILSPTQFRCALMNTYPSGSIVGIDPTPYICGANGMGLCPNDALGYGSDNEPAQYIMEPTIDYDGTRRSTPGVRGLYQPIPITVFNFDQTTSKYENRGFLKYTFQLSNGAYPAIQTEERVKIAGKTYIFFIDTETQRYTNDTRGVLIGPID